jgi:hypothetical protein
MAWRRQHGNARRTQGEGIRWENAHQDPAPKLPPGVGGDIPRDKGGRVQGSEAARQLASLRKAAPDFVRRDVACTPEFEPFNRTRRALTRQRIAELHQQTGGVSRGVGARVRSAAWGYAFGEYLASRAAETGDPELMDRALTILSKASVEDEKARRLAIDEAASRPRENPRDRIAREIREQKAAAARAALPPPTPTRKDDSDGRNDS